MVQQVLVGFIQSHTQHNDMVIWFFVLHAQIGKKYLFLVIYKLLNLSDIRKDFSEVEKEVQKLL